MIRKITEKYLSSKFSRDTVWLILAQIVLMGSGLVINLLIGMQEGAEVLGVFNQSLAYYTILSTLFAFGLNNSLIKKISEGNRSQRDENQLLTANIASTFVLSGFFSATAIGFIMCFPGLLSSPELAGILYIPLMALPFFNMNKNFMAFYSGKRNQKQFALERIIRWLMILTVICLSVALHLGIRAMMYSFLIAEISLFLFNCAGLRKTFDFSFDKQKVIENLSFGIKSYVAEIISVFSASLDLILVGYFLTNTDVGIYSFIVFFVKTLYVFPGIIMQNINPIISNLWASDQLELLNDRIGKIKKINMVVLLMQLSLLLVFYKLITLFVKQEFADSYSYFLIAIVGVFAFALISWAGSMLVMTGKLKENITRTLMVILFSIGSTLLCTYYLGLLGACIAVSLNGLIAVMLTYGFIHRILGVRII